MGLNKRLIDQVGGAAAGAADLLSLQHYTGTGSTFSVTGVGFAPAMSWYKALEHSDHWGMNMLFNTSISYRPSDTLNYISFPYHTLNSDGFTVNSSGGIHNTAGEDFANYVFKGGGTPSNNTDGSITSSVSANVEGGFSTFTYTGTGSNATFGHGLNSAPELVVIKNISDSTRNWIVHFSTLGAGAYMFLNELNANASSTARIAGTSSTTISIGTSVNVNGSGSGYIGFAFHSVDATSKVGSFTGNGNASQDITTGFQPKFLMIKSTASSHWFVFDTIQGTGEGTSNVILANNETLQLTGRDGVDFISNGFRIYDGDNYNTSSQQYVYLAIA